MRWSFTSTTNIITFIVYAVITFVILFFARILVLYLVNGELSLDTIFKPREITPNELSLNTVQVTAPKEPSKVDISVVDSLNKPSKNTNNSTQKAGNVVANISQTDDANKVKVDYYIIVGSFRNQIQARQRAEKVKKDFDANVILLPPTIEGNYRISFGRYSSLEEAKNAIIHVRKNLNSDAWVLTVKN
jgi:hypothetical protein